MGSGVEPACGVLGAASVGVSAAFERLESIDARPSEDSGRERSREEREEKDAEDAVLALARCARSAEDGPLGVGEAAMRSRCSCANSRATALCHVALRVLSSASCFCSSDSVMGLSEHRARENQSWDD